MKKKNKYFADYLNKHMKIDYAINACSGNYLINSLKSAIKNYDHFVPKDTKRDKLEIKGIHPKDVYDRLGIKDEQDIGITIEHPLPLTKKDIIKKVHNAKINKFIGKSINVPLFKKDNLNKALATMTINPVIDKYERNIHQLHKFFNKYKHHNFSHNPMKHHSKNSFSTKSQELKSKLVIPKKTTQPSINNKKKQKLIQMKHQQKFDR